MLKLDGFQKIEEYKLHHGTASLYFEHFSESLITQEIGAIRRLGMNNAG